MGVPIDESIEDLGKKTSLIKISKQIDSIMRHAMRVDIPVIDRYKYHDKFFVLSMSLVQDFVFNRPIIHAGD